MTASETVVIVGAGQAGFQTAASLRGAGFDGSVLLIGEERGLPYQRPPLSKEFLMGACGLETLWLRPRSFYEKHAIDLIDGERVGAIDRAEASVVLSSGRSLSYSQLVLATGAAPRDLIVEGADLHGVVALRTLEDAKALSRRLGAARHAVVVGGGFIGLEVAAIASERGVQVTLVETLPRLMARALSAPMAEFCAAEHGRWGTRILTGCRLERILGDSQGHVVAVETVDGERHRADVVLIGVGVSPNVELAKACGLEIDDGIVVDEHLRTSDPRISAIGDCVRYPSPFSDTPVRLESVQNAVDQARCVAARLVGEPAPYVQVPWFWTEQRDLKLQMVGIGSGHDEAVVHGDLASRSFSVLCFRDARLVSTESVNRPADHMAVRRLFTRVRDPGGALTPAEARDPDLDLKSHLAGFQSAP